MKVGDLVEIKKDAGRGYTGKVGVVTTVEDATVHMPYMMLTVTFPNGDKFSGITRSWVKVLNGSR